mgnify:CR=1 FL=1
MPRNTDMRKQSSLPGSRGRAVRVAVILGTATREKSVNTRF